MIEFAGFTPSERLPADAADTLVACYLVHAGASSDRDVWLNLAEYLSLAEVRTSLKRLRCERYKSVNSFYRSLKVLTDSDYIGGRYGGPLLSTGKFHHYSLRKVA